MIVGVIHDCSAGVAAKRMAQAASWCDLFEVRLDTLHRLHPDDDWSPIFARAPRPTIATYRRSTEGGQFAGDEQEQRDVLQLAIAAGAAYVDLELLAESELVVDAAEVSVIRSVHQLEGRTPRVDTLLDLAKHAEQVGAAVFKIVFPAHAIDDNLIVREVCERAPIPTVAIAAGPLGVPSRILYRALGSVWTYGCLPDDRPAAPGQIDVRLLRERYQAHRLHADSAVYGVLGNPVAHSHGLLLHNAAFRAEPQHEGVYIPLLADSLDRFWRFARSLPLAGFSVTAPFKAQVRRDLDRVVDSASRIGAVNTVTRDAHGRFTGGNTDLPAAFGALAAHLPGGERWYAGRRVLVLGAGGGARTIVAGLLQRGADVLIHNRTPEHVEQLVAHVASPTSAATGQGVPLPGEARGSDRASGICHVRALADIGPEPLDMIVNTTTLGMAPMRDRSPISFADLTAAGVTVARPAFAFDLVYDPAPTRFLREAKDAGLVPVDGRGMFHAQAALQYRAWTGTALPPLEPTDLV